MMKRKYIKRNCNYWGHNFVPLDVDNCLKNGNRIRYCDRCSTHFEISYKGVLSEEITDLVSTVLKDLPDISPSVVQNNKNYKFARIYGQKKN